LEKTKVFFRTDGNTQIGLGHLVRCIALGQMLESQFEVCFFCMEIPEDMLNEVEAYGFKVFIISKEEDFLSRLDRKIIVVLDHYGLSSDYQKTIKRSGCKLVCIDDVPDKQFFADLIINHAPNIYPSDYDAQVYTQFALGLDYVLLRPVFLKKAKEDKKGDTIETAFVCFGGSDNKDLTSLVVNLLKDDDRFKKIVVVTGAAYRNLTTLEVAVEADQRFVLYHAIDSEDLCNLLSCAQLAIVPASGIFLEALAVGIPVISGIYVDNQKNIFEKYKALDAFESAGNFSGKEIVKALDNVFVKREHKDLKLIDGKSGDRLLRAFVQFEVEDQVELRKADEQDLLKTFEWAGNNEIRKFSFNKSAVEFETHKKWFTGKVNDAACFYYLGLFNGKIFGSIRFDLDGSKAIISYLVDPDFQNMGLGTVLLKKALDLFITQISGDISLVYGEVFYDNIASIRVFQKLGYDTELDSSANLAKFKKVIKQY